MRVRLSRGRITWINARPARPFAVDERVDRLELGVGDRRLNHGQKRVVIDKAAQVLQKIPDMFGAGARVGWVS